MIKKLFLIFYMMLCCSLSSDEIMTVQNATQFNEIPTIQTSALDYLKEAGKGEGITRLIFVRHGESNSNKVKSIAGRTINTDLSERGIAQAQNIGQLLDMTNIPFDVVYSSPSLRTMNTAQYLLSKVSNADHLKLNQDDRLLEKWYGPYEGASEDEYAIVIQKEETEIPLLPTFAEKFAFKAHPEMESMEDVYVRVGKFIESMQDEHPGKNILIATHNGIMKALFMADSALRGFDIEYRAFDLGNCSIVVVEVNAEGKMQVVATHGLKFRN